MRSGGPDEPSSQPPPTSSRSLQAPGIFFLRRAFQTKFSGNAGRIFTTGSAEEPLDGFQRGVQPSNCFQTANGPVFGPLFVRRCFNVQKFPPKNRTTDFFLNFSLLLFSHFSTAPLVSRQSRSSCGSWSLSWPLCKACSGAGPNRWGVTEMSGCGWRPEPGLCSTGRWSRKWPPRGGSRFVRLRVLNPCIEKREKSKVLVEKRGEGGKNRKISVFKFAVCADADSCNAEEEEKTAAVPALAGVDPLGGGLRSAERHAG